MGEKDTSGLAAEPPMGGALPFSSIEKPECITRPPAAGRQV